MTGRIDHVAAAKEWVANTVTAQASREPNNEQLATAYAGVAQVHATLALVEQQRIANLIALGSYRVGPNEALVFRHLVLEPRGNIDVAPTAVIREGLGL